MRYLFQFARLLAFCCVGELLHTFLPLPIPASVYGLLLLLAALCTGIVRLEQVQEAGIFLTGIFPLLFVPAAAGVMDLWAELGKMLLARPCCNHPCDASGVCSCRTHDAGHHPPKGEQR